jgi:hypothetical protein
VHPLSIVSKGTIKNKRQMQENNSCGKVIYVGDVQEPVKVNNTCVKTMHGGMMDRGFTVFLICTK